MTRKTSNARKKIEGRYVSKWRSDGTNGNGKIVGYGEATWFRSDEEGTKE